MIGGRMGAAVAAMLAISAMAATAVPQPAQPARRERTRRGIKVVDTTRRYCGMDPEQRQWNDAVDARRAAKKAAKPGVV